MIVDGRGELVWFQQLAPPDVAANLRLQRYAGRAGAHLVAGPGDARPPSASARA